MAPKKQPQQQKGKKNAAGKAGEPATTKASKGAAQVHISSENERKLRQLLANTGGNQFPAAPSKQHEELSEGQKRQAGKRLRNIYDTLVSEGFSASQIEMGLGALPVVSNSQDLSRIGSQNIVVLITMIHLGISSLSVVKLVSKPTRRQIIISS